jgi:stage II sporulation protein M
MVKGKKSVKKRGKKNEFSIKENYKICWNYIKESKGFIWVVVGIFFVFALLGFFVPVPSDISNQLLKYIQEILGQTSGMNAFRLISFIFFNNARSSFFGLIFGIALGIFPVFVSLFNGYILGFVSRRSVNAEGIFVLWKLFPHGIFELPAVWLSLAMGMKIGASLIDGKGKFKENFYASLRVFVSVVIPLLVIAATIEGTLIAVLG